jgi:hypothetical protein
MTNEERWKKYIGKSDIVEAIQWTGENTDEIEKFARDRFFGIAAYNRIKIKTYIEYGSESIYSGFVYVEKFNYLIKHKINNIYTTCPKKTFDKVYMRYKTCPHCGGDV